MQEVIVQNKLLLSTLKKHLKGRVRCSVNLTFMDTFIKVQSSNDFILDTVLPCVYTSKDKPKDFSIMVTGVIDLLKSDDGKTTITKYEDVVIFNQGDISIPFDVSFDERIELKLESIENSGKIGSSDIQSISRGFRHLSNMSKSLEVGVPPVIVSYGKAYCAYSNIISISNVSMVLPDLEIPYNTFNNFSKNLNSSNINVLYDKDSKIIMFQLGNDSSATTNYKIPNLEFINSINNKINELKSIGTFNVSILPKFI